jgi:hypothetical protein
MAQYSGKTYVKCYYPEDDDEWCEVRVDWTRYTYPGDRESPPEDDVEIDKTILMTHNGKNVPRDTEIPDWVTYDELMEGIDLSDCDDDEYEDYKD